MVTNFFSLTPSRHIYDEDPITPQRKLRDTPFPTFIICKIFHHEQLGSMFHYLFVQLLKLLLNASFKIRIILN